MDFVADGLCDGRKLRCLTIVDDCSRECLAIEVDTSINGTTSCSRPGSTRRYCADCRCRSPSTMGPSSKARCSMPGPTSMECRLNFIRPGKPIENAYIESFNGRFRDECLNEHWFLTMAHARRVIEAWRIEYNTERPHSSLGNLTPEQFAKNAELLPPFGRETALRGENVDEAKEKVNS